MRKKLLKYISLLPFSLTLAYVVFMICMLFQKHNTRIEELLFFSAAFIVLFVPVLAAEYDIYRLAKYFYIFPETKSTAKNVLAIIRIVVCTAIFVLFIWDYLDISLFSVMIDTIYTAIISYALFILDIIAAAISSKLK